MPTTTTAQLKRAALHRQAMAGMFTNLLAAHDRALTMLRTNWLTSEGKQDRKGQADWMGRINESLDERLVVMRQRDAATTTTHPTL